MLIGGFKMKNIKEFVQKWKEELRERLHGEVRRFAIIQVGNLEASNRYVRNKIADCAQIGITAELFKLDENIPIELLECQIKDLEKQHYDAIMVQLPLPPHLSAHMERIKNAIPKNADVDGFRIDSPYNPCTPKGIVKYLEYCDFPIEGSHIVIIGRSEIVGKPLARMLIEKDATVTLCHSKTRDLDKFIDSADLIICAVGKAKFLNCYSIHVPVIDVGINFDENGKMVGDCFNTENRDVTPVPGGVGLLTRCALLDNIVIQN